MIKVELMEYNTKRSNLLYREYGRNVKKMIEYVCAIENEEKRSRAVVAVADMMARVAGVSINDSVSAHKIWDHLMVMSEFKLDGDWPYGAEELTELKKRTQEGGEYKQTERLAYNNSHISNRLYGAYLEQMMKKLGNIEEGEEYEALITLVAQQAKRNYLVWNGELSDDDIVVNQMAKVSGDPRVEALLKGKGITVFSGSLPTDAERNGKRKKKKKK